MIGCTRPDSGVFATPDEEFYYPEGEQLPVDGRHWHACIDVVLPLRAWLRGRPGGSRTWVGTALPILYNRSGDCWEVTPDVAVCFDVDGAEQERRGYYRVWETGVAPAWVLEVASRHPHYYDQMKYYSGSPITMYDHPNIMSDPEVFAALGVAEFWRTDPTGENILTTPLQGYRLADGRWHPITITEDSDRLLGHSNVLGLDLCWQDGDLRLYDPAASKWLLAYDDLLAAHTAAEARATAAGRHKEHA